MNLSDKDKEFIKANRIRLTSKQISQRLGVERKDIERYIHSLSTGISAPTKENNANPAPTKIFKDNKFILRLDIFWSLAVLAIQHFVIFYQHYLGSVGFAGDFLAAQAVPFYWITCIQQGMFPQWIPFEAMGYPFLLNTVSGLFYVPLWIFVFLGKNFTHQAAVIFQCLHIFLGAVGMYYFCRRLRLAWAYALVAAMAYQVFGGFYHNSIHDVIVRSYAILPWLLAGFCLNCSWRVRVILIPLSIYLLFTGGYPGTAMAEMFVAILFVLCQFYLETDIPIKNRQSFLWKCFMLSVVGILVSAIYLLPVWLHRSEIARFDEFSSQKVNFFGFIDYFTLFMSSSSKHLGKMVISMRSLFVTLPIFVMLFFLKKEDFRKYSSLCFIGIFSILMSSSGLFHSVVTNLVSPLAFSRFPCADYRALIAIMFIVLGAIGFGRFAERQFSLTETLTRVVLPFVMVLSGWKFLELPGNEEALFWISLFLFTGFLIFSTQHAMPKKIVLVIFMFLITVNGMFAHSQIVNLWKLDKYSVYVRDDFNHIVDSAQKPYDFDSQMTDAKSLKQSLKAELKPRPERRMPLEKDEYMKGAYSFSWRGYLTGDYMLIDYSNGMQLWRQKKAFSDPVVRKYMMKPSSPMVYESDKKVASMDELKLLLESRAGSGVVTKSYKTEEVVYQVNLKNPSLLIENEMYFSGWKGQISHPSKGLVTLIPEAAGGVLRAWHLPEGEYELRLRFDMPFLKLSAMLSLAALLVWFGLIGFSFMSKLNVFEN